MQWPWGQSSANNKDDDDNNNNSNNDSISGPPFHLPKGKEKEEEDTKKDQKNKKEEKGSAAPLNPPPEENGRDLTRPLPILPQSSPRPAHKQTDYTSIVSPYSVFIPDPADLLAPSQLVPVLLLTGSLLGLVAFWKSYVRRIPGADNINPGFFRRRSLFGQVTSVGDGDNFRLFHTPGGRWMGWGWLRRVPRERRVLKDRTIHIRLAGIDAPELPHFGKPAQPHSREALSFLTSYILHRRVRCYIYRRDQYARVVATVYVRNWWPSLKLLRTDVGLQMLRRGLAGVYEGKMGAEFGGGKEERRYLAAEEVARRKGVGLWAGERKGMVMGMKRIFGFQGTGKVETPGEFKKRVSGENQNQNQKQN